MQRLSLLAACFFKTLMWFRGDGSCNRKQESSFTHSHFSQNRQLSHHISPGQVAPINMATSGKRRTGLKPMLNYKEFTMLTSPPACLQQKFCSCHDMDLSLWVWLYMQPCCSFILSANQRVLINLFGGIISHVCSHQPIQSSSAGMIPFVIFCDKSIKYFIGNILHVSIIQTKLLLSKCRSWTAVTSPRIFPLYIVHSSRFTYLYLHYLYLLAPYHLLTLLAPVFWQTPVEQDGLAPHTRLYTDCEV